MSEKMREGNDASVEEKDMSEVLLLRKIMREENEMEWCCCKKMRENDVEYRCFKHQINFSRLMSVLTGMIGFVGSRCVV